jgi:hypothetical protein
MHHPQEEPVSTTAVVALGAVLVAVGARLT